MVLRTSSGDVKRLKPVTTDNNCHLKPLSGELDVADSKYCINNPLQIINQHESSGGVEALFAKKSHTVRLSISPSQGDDPGFKSRPEHLQ